MAAIRANAESILEGLEEEDRDRLLRNLVREVARGDRLITSLLTMARLDQGQGVVPAPCDILFLCSDEVDRTWSLAPHLDIVVRAEELQSEPVEVDARAVREILSNLLDNARRHAVESIRLLIAVRHPSLEIRVVDDGPGIPAHLTDRAFERFVSLDGKGGSGLGLPIARELARAHGGDLSYASREEGFLLRLPLNAPAKWRAEPGNRPHCATFVNGDQPAPFPLGRLRPAGHETFPSLVLAVECPHQAVMPAVERIEWAGQQQEASVAADHVPLYAQPIAEVGQREVDRLCLLVVAQPKPEGATRLHVLDPDPPTSSPDKDHAAPPISVPQALSSLTTARSGLPKRRCRASPE